MNLPGRGRMRFPLMVLGCAAASTATAFLIHWGEWSQFGGIFAVLSSGWRSPGYRWTFLSRWILPLFLAYLIVLCGGIFFGLRRRKRGAH